MSAIVSDTGHAASDLVTAKPYRYMLRVASIDTRQVPLGFRVLPRGTSYRRAHILRQGFRHMTAKKAGAAEGGAVA
jgi:hypothetical protein